MILGVAGTAKNTGKTTAMLAVMEYLRSTGIGLFLTSIGYDGEDADNLTGLPKPRIFMRPGDLVSSALPALKGSLASFEDMVPTGVQSALGPVCRARVAAPGRVIVAGPPSTAGLSLVLQGVPRDRVALLDGAFSRLAPMSLATHVIVATGAARYSDPLQVAAEMRSTGLVMSLPAYPIDGTFDVHVPGGLYAEGQDRYLAGVLLEGERTIQRVHIDGVISPEAFGRMLAGIRYLRSRLTFIVSHPVYLLISGDISLWEGVFEDVKEAGHRLVSFRSSKLLGFTLSPFKPLFDPAKNAYTESYVPARSFAEKIRKQAGFPCTDLVLEGPALLHSWLAAARIP